jgi:glycosyltransferase involved in cell wall biosynthesis
MRIAMVCPRGVPFVVGGAERLWAGLVAAINDQTPHEASLVEIDSPERSLREVLFSYTRFDQLDLDDFDMVISGKYPAWMVRHRHHVIHMCHPLRGLYDMYPSSWPLSPTVQSSVAQDLVTTLRRCRPGTDEGRSDVLRMSLDMVEALDDHHPDLAFPAPLARQVIHWLDADALHPSRIARYSAISRVVSKRPDYFPPTVPVEVLVPPSGLAGLHQGEFKNFFTASRLDHPKRLDLLIEAFRTVAGPYNLRIAGVGPMEQHLRSIASGDQRVTFLGFISDERLVEEYASALAVPFIPYLEDLGLITIEAQMSGKPVITCIDSGGTADLVEHGVDGLVVEPTVRALAEAMQTLGSQPLLAETLGKRGRLRALELDWPSLVRGLLEMPTPQRSPARRPRLLVLSTYPANPARHGGQVRINRLYSVLAEHYDVHLIALGDGQATSGAIASGFWQTVIDPPGAYHELNGLLSSQTGVPTGDIAATLSADTMDQLHAAVEAESAGVAAVVLCQPYLYPFVRSLDNRIPVIYDSQNAEWSLKKEMYPESDVGRALAVAVAEVESDTIASAALVTAVSEDDLRLLRGLQDTMAEFVLVPNGSDVISTSFVTGDDRRQRRTAYLDSLCRAGFHTDCDSVAVFVGSAHPPNITAAREVLAVAAQLPSTLFLLVGTHVDALDGVPTGTNVISRGSVDREEMTTILSLCDVALNPMKSGSGTNIKMIDYFAAGAPAIASTIGARGLSAVDRRDVLIADNATDLIRSIKLILAESSVADDRARSARRLAEAFDWQASGALLTRAMSICLARPRTL